LSEEATILNEGYLPDVDATQAVDSKLNGNETKAAPWFIGNNSSA